MAVLYIPTVGAKFVLEKEWTFTLHREHRNFDLIEVACSDWDVKAPVLEDRRHIFSKGEGAEDIRVTIPPGTCLTLDRLYIRHGLQDFDSLTFILTDCPDAILKPKKLGGQRTGRIRFWAKLEEANGMEYVLADDNVKKGDEPLKIDASDFERINLGETIHISVSRTARIRRMNEGDSVDLVVKGRRKNVETVRAIVVRHGVWSLDLKKWDERD